MNKEDIKTGDSLWKYINAGSYGYRKSQWIPVLVVRHTSMYVVVRFAAASGKVVERAVNTDGLSRESTNV